MKWRRTEVTAVNGHAPAPSATGNADTPQMRFDYTRTGPIQIARVSGGATPGQWALLGLVAAAFLLLYRINFLQLLAVWYSNPNFSMGFVIPLISAFFVYLQWPTLQSLPVKHHPLGLALLAFGVSVQTLFLICGQIQFSHLSMFVVLFGLVLWLLGWEQMKILWLPICYLIFMINPPQALYVKFTTPLQYLSASAGVHLLPLFGVNAIRTATQVHIQVGTHWESLNVAQACSGIRMLTAFFALAIALAYSSQRPMWQKIVLALCALPIAIACNALRVTLTVVLFVTAGSEWARGSTHASLGLLMLIPAFLLQIGAAWIIDLIASNLLVEERAGQPSAPLGAKAS